MKIDIATLFPDMTEVYLSESIIGRARKSGAIYIKCHNIRDYTENKHRRVDDKAFGGGTGMVIQAQPVYDCIQSIIGNNGKAEKKSRLIYMSPQGRVLTQEVVKELAQEEHLVILCGHYEGVDQRVLDELDFEEISIGDYVVTGGEMPALILTDAVARLISGVLPNEEAFTEESHYKGILEHPLYTRPEEWRGKKVPEVLASGHHKKIKEWQNEKSTEITLQKRPDLARNQRNIDE